MRRCNDRCR